MSVIVSNCEQICKSPTNDSKAKMLYSFPKSPRFPKNTYNECDRFYEISNKGMKRTTSLGYGNKYDFTRDMPKTPAPGEYEAETLFEASKRKNKGIGFGSGRGEMQSTGFIKKNENPGPGAYQQQQVKSRIAFSVKGKAKIDDREKIYVPGPGTYENPSTFNKKGTCYSSRFLNKSGTYFSKQKKLKIEDLKVPGPGTYEYSKISLSPEGKYSLSRLQSAKTSKFGKAMRLQNKNRCQTPGPGNYRLPSQFGYYESRQAFKQLTNAGQ